MRELIEQILREVVTHKDSVVITEVAGEKTRIFEIRCHKEDVGKVIGKSGKTIGAIRNLLGVLAGRDGKKAVLEVVE